MIRDYLCPAMLQLVELVRASMRSCPRMVRGSLPRGGLGGPRVPMVRADGRCQSPLDGVMMTHCFARAVVARTLTSPASRHRVHLG